MGEAYLVIYEQTDRSRRTAAMIIGKEAHTRRAERHPDYLGMEAGLIVQREGGIEQVKGAFLAPGDQLLGGWCQVRRKGRELPDFISVSLKEYDNGRRQWKQMPGTMIRKVAVVQALREAFPNEMAGLQGGDEFILPEEYSQVVEGQLAEIPVAPTAPRVDRDLERDIDDLFPGPTMPSPEEAEWPPPEPDEVFDPATAPPPPLPEHVSAMTHFEAVLKDNGWDVARLQNELLNVPLANYLRTHKLDEAYQLVRQHRRV
jgi:phage recombination protein Bet